jgi:hypothetical protein
MKTLKSWAILVSVAAPALFAPRLAAATPTSEQTASATSLIQVLRKRRWRSPSSSCALTWRRRQDQGWLDYKKDYTKDAACLAATPPATEGRHRQRNHGSGCGAADAGTAPTSHK